MWNLAIGTWLLVSCKSNPTETATGQHPDLTVTEDSIFNAFFFPGGNGFTGGDGTYSVLLPDGRSVWIFGDSFIGNVTQDLKRIKTEPQYIRNCFVLLEKDSLITLQQGKPDEFKSMMIPPEVNDRKKGYREQDIWYWPGDGLVENGKLYVFTSKFFQEDHTDMWAFKFQGTELLEFSLPDFKVQNIMRFANTDSVHYGHAVLETKNYTYIYGLKNQFPYVARAGSGKVGQARIPWQFYTGSGWTDRANEAAPILKFSGSEQFSVFEWKGTYVMIMQGGNLSGNIYSFTSQNPFGPWENQQLLYETPVPDNCQACWTYNALAHPQFTRDDQLLVSYNTNSMNMQDHYDNATLYRPRFIRIPMAKILKK